MVHTPWHRGCFGQSALFSSLDEVLFFFFFFFGGGVNGVKRSTPTYSLLIHTELSSKILGMHRIYFIQVAFILPNDLFNNGPYVCMLSKDSNDQ